MSPGMDYMLNQARYPHWETEARLRAVKPAGREARSVDGKTAQQRFHFHIWLPLWTVGTQACARKRRSPIYGIRDSVPAGMPHGGPRKGGHEFDYGWLAIKKCK